MYLLTILVMYSQSHIEQKPKNYQEVIFKTTIGNIASTIHNCYSISRTNIETYALSSIPLKIQLNCESYSISAINLFGASKNYITDIYNIQQCHNFYHSQNITLHDDCNFVGNITILAKDCITQGQSKCEFDINIKNYLNQCGNNENWDKWYLGYSC